MSHRWIRYSEPAPKGVDELYLSISPRGRTVFGRRTYEALGEPTHVQLMFDPDTDSIGIEPSPPRAVNAFRMQPAGKYGTHVIMIRRFLTKHELQLDYTVRFPEAHIDDGILVLDLPTRVPAVTGRRRRGA